MKKTIGLAILALGMYCGSSAQGFRMPQPSSTQTITQDLGLGKVTVTYSRPNIRGRNAFRDLAPYGQVWRTGANATTSIQFSDDVTVEGQPLPAGTYALFTIPGQNQWTVIFNKSREWGSYTYKQSDDVLRITVPAVRAPYFSETFQIGFRDVFPEKAEMYLAWENTAVPIHIVTNIDQRVMSGIDDAMRAEKKPYFSAAQYYYEHGKDLRKALEWMNAAQASDPKPGPYYPLWRGRIQLKMGMKREAAASAEEGIRMARAAGGELGAEYVRLNEALLAQARM